MVENGLREGRAATVDEESVIGSRILYVVFLLIKLRGVIDSPAKN
jgi:hypothetical protein